MEFPNIINGTSPFPYQGFLGGIFHFFKFQYAVLWANSENPDQSPHFVASDLGLHCMPLNCPTKRTLGINGLRNSLLP